VPNPDWKYGDILRPRYPVRGGYERSDRVMFLTFDNEMGPDWITSVNLTMTVDNETWMTQYELWELDTDA
jgi:hypothetical protein